LFHSHPFRTKFDQPYIASLLIAGIAFGISSGILTVMGILIKNAFVPDKFIEKRKLTVGAQCYRTLITRTSGFFGLPGS